MSCRRLVMFWVLAAHVAYGEPGADKPGAEGAAKVDDKKHAGELAEESQAHYKRGEFEVSAALLRQAYALYPEPNLLYNLGRSLEGFGDKQGAVNAYKDYLATAAQIEDRGAIERRIATLQQDIDKDKPVEKPIEKPAETPKPIEKPIEHRDSESAGSLAPWLTVGAGVLIAGGGVAFGFEARSNHDSATHALTGTATQTYSDNAHRDALFANIGYAVGGAAIVGGVIWAIATHGSSDRVSSIHPSVTATSVALEWTVF